MGPLDLGLSYFTGTSREPRLVPEGTEGFRPHYDLIDELGLTLQWTHGSSLWKLEALRRWGHGAPFQAVVGGIEYSLFGLFGTATDLGLLAQLSLDDREPERAPATLWDEDLFLGARWALNDPNDTAILGGPVIDLDSGEIFAFLEAGRRIGMSWMVELEARVLASTSSASPAYWIRGDSFATFRLSRYF